MNYTTCDYIIINYNTPDLTCRCIETVLTSVPSEMKLTIVVVDNASSDDSVEIIKKRFPAVRIIANIENRGYGAAANQAVWATSSEYVVVSNSDIELLPAHENISGKSTLETLIAYMSTDKKIGVVGGQQMYRNGSWQRSFGLVPSVWAGISRALFLTFFTRRFFAILFALNYRLPAFPVSYIDGGMMLFRRAALEKVAGFDEDFFFYGEESDLCFRLRKKHWKCHFVPQARLIHARGGTRERSEAQLEKFVNLDTQSYIIFLQKHSTFFLSIIFLLLEILYFAEVSFVYKIASFFTPSADHTSHLMWLFCRSTASRLRIFVANRLK